MTDSIRAILIESVMRLLESKTASEHSVSSALFGIAKLEFELSDFPSTFQNLVFRAVNQISSSVTPQGLGNILYSLGKIGIVWSSLTNQTQFVLKDSIIRLASSMNEIGISTVLYSLGKMDMTMTQYYDVEFLTILLNELNIKVNNMTHAALANAVYGLGRMSIYVDDPLRTKLVASVSKACREMTEQELGNCVWGLGD